MGINPRDGDAVLIRAGADKYWSQNPDMKLFFPPNIPGSARSIIEYLYDISAALLGWDLQESGHRDYDFPAQFPIHEMIIAYMGMPILDNANKRKFRRLSETLFRTRLLRVFVHHSTSNCRGRDRFAC